MKRSDALSVLSGVAADQWGLVTAAQAKDAGVGGVQLKRLTDTGLLENVARGVYLLTAAGQPPHLEIKAAWLRLQPAVPAWQRDPADPQSGVVSHTSACELLELGDIPTIGVELSVPKRRVTQDRSVRLRTAVVDPAETTVVDGLPVTTAHRTVVDLLRARADGGHVGGVIASAERRDMLALSALADDVAPFARAYGMPRGASGEEFIEHLAEQGGEHLRAQELQRAAEEGFSEALTLFSSSQAERWRELMRRQDPVLPPNNIARQLLADAVVTPGLGRSMAGFRQWLARDSGLARVSDDIRERQAELLAPVASGARKNLRLATENGLTRVMKDLQKGSPQMRHALEMNRRSARLTERQRSAGSGQPIPGRPTDEDSPEP
ncbi:type IV toxin-antitoxin system AbiEi family antitoxin domain-containing protein [Streptomyces sp. NPDC006925]|uniref:type IV toxin-antitoxin system AbiEi family antitoxin domain-containing protein n=1 Tax=Streptomyces sp. NPDC006925 TaxID=3364768 RepID=UPI00368845C3